MADTLPNSVETRIGEAQASEAADLRALAEQLAAHAPRLKPSVLTLEQAFAAGLAAARHPSAAERTAEGFARSLRALWLEACGREAASVYRSPTEAESDRIARHHDAFGYERDLQPETLERRCAEFFPPPPRGWRVEHILFSSGQAAMTTALVGLARVASDGSCMRVAHCGAYFETRSLLGGLPFLAEASLCERADVAIIEPICCDGRFHQIDPPERPFASARAIVFDTTLLGRNDPVGSYLTAMGAGGRQTVLRVASCLKLFQSGLELANCGVLSVYTSHDSLSGLADQFRRLRTIMGAGLHLVDAIALEAPFVFDTGQADAYAAAIFAHNGELARAVERANHRFEPVSHPAFDGAGAPFCAFRLRDASVSAYNALEAEIASEASRRRCNFAHGGSFGFRGHRYEVVRPETGDAPFLRIAMGRRGGFSCEGVIDMMAAIAQR